MKISFNGLLAVLLVMLMASVVVAQSIGTHIIFVVPTIFAFRVTLPGTGGYNSSSGATNITQDIMFNVSDATLQNISTSGLSIGNLFIIGINATRRYVPTDAQSADSGIFNYTNIGNIGLNISVVLDAALPNMPGTASTIRLYAGNASGSWAQPCSFVGLGADKCVYINNTAAHSVVQNISTGWTSSVWFWADFLNVSIGTTQVNATHIRMDT